MEIKRFCEQMTREFRCPDRVAHEAVAVVLNSDRVRGEVAREMHKIIHRNTLALKEEGGVHGLFD